MNAPHVLSVERLNVGYPGRQVVADLSLAPFAGGSLTALVGPNAAGKTTLLRGLAGLARASGTVRLDGEDMLALAPAQRARHVSYMPQALPQRVALTVYEGVLAAVNAVPLGISSAQARARADAALERLSITALAMRPLDALSGGQRQLASLAQAIVREPRVLLLDEPTSALDMRHQLGVMKTVAELARERGAVAMVVLHDIALAARWCDRIVVLGNGKVAADGTPDQAITPAMLADVYGIEARVERCSRGTLQIIPDAVIAR